MHGIWNISKCAFEFTIFIVVPYASIIQANASKSTSFSGICSLINIAREVRR